MTFVDLERFHVTRHLRLASIAGVLQKARRETSLETLEKYAHQAKNGVPVFIESKPLLMHLPRRGVRQVVAALEPYRETLAIERKVLLDRDSPVDVAFKVVGPGSVGPRDYVVRLLDHGLKDPLF